ncbi:serine/threonine protein kinase, partial [bacterium]|nr:serine/threonine protein kinase [bacterium]
MESLSCPGCGRPVPLSRWPSGKTATCASCGASVRAPDPRAEPTTETGIARLPATREQAPSDPAGPALAPSGDIRESISQEVARTSTDPARRLGPFVLLSELGRGGMGVVWRAWDERLKRHVALKTILTRGDPVTEQARKRFQRETAETELAGQPRSDRIALTKALEALRDAALAVNYAHEQGVVHRDLKPQNIMLDSDDRPHVLDFGIALLRDADGTKLTRVGTRLGTLAYMSPEQASGGQVDARSDVYSLGATLYDVLTNRPPFVGESDLELLAALAGSEAEPPGSINPRAAGDLETIC